MASRERTAAPRQRGDKSRPPAAAAPEPHSGRLGEARWLSLLQAEDGDEAVAAALDGLLGAVLQCCFQAYLGRQRVPFTIAWARAVLLQAAEWCFPARDEGDAELEAAGAWQEDEEPPPCTADAWAQGAVPVLREHPAPGHREVSDAALSEAEGGSVPAPSHPSPQDKVLSAPQPPAAAPSGRPIPAPLPTIVISPCVARCRRSPCLKRPTPQGQVEAGSAAEAGGHRAPRPPPRSDPRKLQGWRAPHSSGGAWDKPSTALGSPRADLERWIWPQVEVLEPGAEAKRQPRALRRRRPRSRSRQDAEPGSPGLAAAGAPQLFPPIPGPRQPGSPQPPALGSVLGAVRLAPGVTIRRGGSEGQQLCLPERGNEEEEEKEEETREARRDLRPLRPTVPLPAIAVSRVTGDSAS